MKPNASAVRKIQAFDLNGFKDKQKKYEESVQAIPKTDPWINIRFGDTVLKIEFSFGAVREFYRESGKNINSGDLKMEDLNDMDLLFMVIKCGLRAHHPEITDEWLENALTMKHRLYYAQIISKAIEATQPDYDQLDAMMGDLKALTSGLEEEVEAGDTTAPLPEIVPSPISGPLADNS